MLENIEQYLKKHYNLKPTGKIIRTEVIRAIHVVTNVTLTDKEVTVHQHQVFLRTKPVKRSEILRRQVEILEEIKENGIAEGIRVLR